MALQAAAKAYRQVYGYERSTDSLNPWSSDTCSQMENNKANNKSYAIALKCGSHNCRKSNSCPILAIIMKECDVDIDPWKREFMEFYTTRNATNVGAHPRILQSS
jgi:hypothetical protein